MNTDEILQNLTTTQRAELDSEIALATKKVSAAYQKDPVTFAEINTPVRLSGDIFLNVTLVLYNGDKGVVHPVIENMHRFDTMDAYLDAFKTYSEQMKASNKLH